MRKKIFNYFALPILLGCFALLSITKISFAPVDDDRMPVLTYCCLNGILVGYSNDCPPGVGNCTEKGCGPNETEECNSNCTS